MTLDDANSVVTNPELDKEMPPRILIAVNPQRLENVASFNTKEKQWFVNEQLSHLVVHFVNEGSLVHVSSPKYAASKNLKSLSSGMESVSEDALLNSILNQFEYSDRFCQTVNAVVCEGGCSTSPPPRNDHNGVVSVSVLYDAYVGGDKNVTVPSLDLIYSLEMECAARIMERIVNLNVDSEIFGDYKYYEDKSDSYRATGSLLPLWKFVNEKNRRLGLQIMCIKWNPKYSDLFATAYGSYEFLKQSVGMLGVYSFKNANCPFTLLQCESSVCCLDWNKSNPALLAVGLYDGSVAVFDVRSNNFLFQSNKHLDPVWEVVWTSESQFSSISVDGNISNWTMGKSCLVFEPVTAIKENPAVPLSTPANALCFDFNPIDPDRYLVGTEEGKVHLCVRYLRQQVETWTHTDGMAVYAVKWNPVDSRVFASAAADWTVKVWKGACVCVYELGAAVGDLAWSSATVFAAVTADGNAFVCDIERNRNKEICCQRVIKRGKLTRVALANPTILVGDDQGVVYALKLSPNLRSNPPQERLDHVLDLITSLYSERVHTTVENRNRNFTLTTCVI